MQSVMMKIRYYSFELRVNGNAPASLHRCIDSKTLNPGSLSGAGVLYFQYLLPVKTGPASPANLGCLAIDSHYVTPLFMRPKFSGLKIWTLLYPLGKLFGMGLAKPS